MMLRRRTERKAKAAASSLFKRVASGQDWNPSSPSTFIPVKRTSPKSKTVAKKAVKPVKRVTTCSKVAVVSLKKETSRTPQKAGSLQKKGDTKVQEKSRIMPRKGGVKQQEKTDNSHKKGVDVTQRQVRTTAKKTEASTSALAKKAVAKVLPILDASLRRQSVAVVSPKKGDSLVLQKSLTPPKKGVLVLQKLVASPEKIKVESLLKTDVRIIPDIEKMDSVMFGDKPDKRKVMCRSVKERSTELIKKPDEVIPVSPLKHRTSPTKESTCGKTDSDFTCHTRKRKLEPELESLTASPNDVCIELTRVDEKSFTIVDQTIDVKTINVTESKITGQARNGEIQEGTLLSLLNAPIATDRMDRDTIAYPSDRIPSVVFLAMLGLVPKSDIKLLEGSPNKLHREAGGKLRRILKPRLMPGMVYRKVTIAKGLSLTGIVIDHQLKPSTKSMTSLPSAMQNVHQSKSKVSTFSSVTKFTLLRKDHPPLVASPKLPKIRSTPKIEVEAAVPLESKPEDPSVGVGVEEKMTEEVLTSLSDKHAEEMKETELATLTVVQSPVKQKCVPKKKEEPTKPCCVLNVTSDLEPMARRSARQQGNKRRVWGHLLRANPDEFEERNKWVMSTKDPTLNLLMMSSLENDAKKPTDKMTNDDLTVVDVVGGALSDNGKPVQDSHACETQSSQESDCSHTESSISSPIKEAPTEIPCSLQSAPDRKSTPVKKHAQVTGKRQKKVQKDGVDGKSLRVSTTMSLACKSSAVEKMEDVNRVLKSRSESKVKKLDIHSFSNYSFLSYRYKDSDCKTPHMCSICWVNDHMYCCNMKRTANDLPPFGGCIHYIPCSHYWPLSPSSALRISSSDHNSFHNHLSDASSTSGVGDQREGSSTVERAWNDDDLMCREQMIDSDSESHSPIPPRGTEILGIQLKTRAEQIIRSLGIDRMPESLDLRGVTRMESSQDLEKEKEAEEDCNVVVEEYGAEMCIDNNEETDDFQATKLEVQKDSLDDPYTTSKLPRVEGQVSGSAVDGPGENVSQFCIENCDRLPNGAVFGVPIELSSGPLSSNMCVIRVQVQKLDSDRVRVTYPKVLEGRTPGDDCDGGFVQKEVKFPTGADEKSLNEFLAQEAVRLVNEAPTEVQRKAVMGLKKTTKSGSVEHKQGRGTKRSISSATCPAKPAVPSVPKNKSKGMVRESGCLDQTTSAWKERLSPHPKKRSRKILCPLDLVSPGSEVPIVSTAFPINIKCLPNMGTGMDSSVPEFSLPEMMSQVPLSDVGSSIRDLTKMDFSWSCSSSRILGGDLAMLDSTSHSTNPIIPNAVPNPAAPSVVHPVGCFVLGEIPDVLKAKPYTLDPVDQEGQSVSAYQDQVASVNFGQGLPDSAGSDQDIQSNRRVDFDPRTLVCDAATSLSGSTVIFHPYNCVDSSKLLPVCREKDLEQSCFYAQILQQQDSVSSSQSLVNTVSSGRRTGICATPLPAKTSLTSLSGPRTILPYNPPLIRSQPCNSVGSVSAAQSSITGTVPGAITRTTGLLIPLGFSVPGPFISVTNRLPPQLSHLPISATVCNSQQTKANGLELANVALANTAFSNAALTGITLASSLPVKVAMGCTAPTNLAFANVASTNLTSGSSLAPTNLVLKNVSCPNLATANVAFGNSSSLRKAYANIASVNVTPTSMASVGAVSLGVTPLNVTTTSLASSVNIAVADITSGKTIICMQPTGVGPPLMKFTRLDNSLAGSNVLPLLISQAQSVTPNAIVSTRPSHTDYHGTQSCAMTVQSPSFNMTKQCNTAPFPLPLTGAPTSNILQMAWNQCNDDCSESVSCKGDSDAGVVSSVSNVSPTFFSVVEESNIIL